MAKTIEAVTKSEKAYREMRRMIEDGRLKPGQPLVHRVLAEKLVMSNIPIIDALRRLRAEGLVEGRPHSHARVKGWKVRDHIERLIMRESLEGTAARWCAQRATDEELQELRGLAERVDPVSVGQMSDGSHADLDAQFHLLVARFCGLELVEKELRRFDLLQRTMSKGNCPQRRELLPGGHQVIVAAIASRDPDRAEQVMREHLREARQWFIGVADKLGLLQDHEDLIEKREKKGG